MSVKAVTDFWARIDSEPAFSGEFSAAMPARLNSGAPIVSFASKHGFDFTEQELQQAAAAATGKGELNEGDLGAVVGGAGSIANSLSTASSSRVLQSLSALKPGGSVAW
jgi:predicted ribosomally synthesized peptide with nif11-like leader